jgi:hypothetical protein
MGYRAFFSHVKKPVPLKRLWNQFLVVRSALPSLPKIAATLFSGDLVRELRSAISVERVTRENAPQPARHIAAPPSARSGSKKKAADENKTCMF